MDVCLRLTDYYEIYALHRAVIEAKFSADPRDTEIRGSPFVASAANKILDTLIMMERSLGRDEQALAWEAKRQMDPDLYTDIWHAALKGVEASREWPKWNSDEKKRYAMILLSPFVASNTVLNRFVEEADKAAWA